MIEKREWERRDTGEPVTIHYEVEYESPTSTACVVTVLDVFDAEGNQVELSREEAALIQASLEEDAGEYPPEPDWDEKE